MRTGPAADHEGYFHEALCYSSDDEFLAVAVPFLLDGVAAGEPTLVSLTGRTAALVRSALPADTAVRFLGHDGLYRRPAPAIRLYQRLLAGEVRDGAAQVRIIGELPRAALGAARDVWSRYESVINHAFRELPVWGLCPYDTRLAPAGVLDEVARTHPWAALPDGRHVPWPTYTDPATYLREPRPVPVDPIERTPPRVELADPSPAQARAAVHAADHGRISADDVDDLVVAVSETVTNAVRHGRPPVCFRLWTAPDRIVVTVTDSGPGPTDPFAGLLPAGTGAAGGLGLWITFQSCDHVSLHRGPDSFTVRLTTGIPHLDG